MLTVTLKACSQHFSVNSHIKIYALRTNRALTVLIYLQPVSMKNSRDAGARDQ